MRPVPDALRGRLFTRPEALAAGVTSGMLRGPGIEWVSAGLYCHTGTPLTLDRLAPALLGLLPPDAVLSHTSNLAWRGLVLAPTLPLHVATRRDRRCRRPEVVLHRYQHALEVETVRDLPVLTPARTFVDCGTVLSLRQMVQVGDWLVAQRLVDLIDLRTYVIESHLDGVQRARKAAEIVRGAPSPCASPCCASSWWRADSPSLR